MLTMIKNRTLFYSSILLMMLLICGEVFAQTEDKIVTITDPNYPGDAAQYSGTYVYQGTRSSVGDGPVQVRPYYKNGTYYLYAEYMLTSGGNTFPGTFAWFITDNILTVGPAYKYVGWDETSGMDYPEECTWWDNRYESGNVTVVVQNAASGEPPSVTTLEASLVTTTSGTMGGNVTADGGAVTDRGFVYSSTDVTPTIGEGGVTQITKGTGTGTYTEVIAGLTAGVTYYYQAYGHNEHGTTYGGVKSFTTPTTSSPNKYVSGITNDNAANEVYIWIGNYYGKPAWKHETLNYWVYYSITGASNPTVYKWYIDVQLRNEHGAGDHYFYHDDAATCPSSGWASGSGNGIGTGTPSVVDYPQIDFTDGLAYSPGNSTGGTNNNPIGRFFLDADIAGASLTAATITVSGTRTNVTNLKLWSSTDATFNSGGDTQLNSQSDGASVTFSGFSSAISASGTYYFITADLASSASGTITLTIGSKTNLTYSGGASSTVFTNAALTSGTITISGIPEMNVQGNSRTIADGDTEPSSSDHTDFGTTNVTSGTVIRTFTIQNLGGGTLNLGGSSPYISISGTHSSDFSVTSIPSNSIAASSSTTFQITFDPSAAGVRSATLSIENNDSDENPYNFSIQGTGLAVPTVTTQAVSNIGSTNATGNGNITDLGNPNPTAYGICYGAEANPDINGNKVNKGAASATGAFTAQLIGLTPGTTYHVRAFATNDVGTVYGDDVTFTTTSTMTEPGNALNFDGSDDYVVTTDNDNGLTAFTIEAWVKWCPSATTDVQFICGKGYEQMELHTGAGANDLRFIPTTGVYLDADNVLSTGVWTHIAVVYNPSTSLAKMYINGSEVTLVNSGPNPISTAIANTATSFYIGSRSDASYHFKGSLDELRVWNLVRSQADIQADMDNSISASSSGLINYYNFNEGTAGGSNTTGSSILPDLTSNGNNGTITNFALTGSTSNWVESYALVVPVASTASSVSAGSFTANWIAPVTGTVNNYLLEVASDASFSTLLSGYDPKTIESSSTTSPVTGLSANTNYYYRVCADKTTVTGTGANSNSVTVTTSAATITFTDGSGFTQSIIPGSTDLPLGRFQLTSDASGATLTAVSIKLNGTRTGLSNLKLWSSTDDSFGGDTKIGSTVAEDPGDGASVSFSSLSAAVNTSGVYYFITANVAADASGTVQAVISENSSLTISDGTLSGSISDALLSGNTAPLPVELISFTASVSRAVVSLNWKTETEIDNYGFEIERRIKNNGNEVYCNWEKVGFVEGYGNSNSPKDYSFIDRNIQIGFIQYRLKQIDLTGNYEYSEIADVKVEVPTEYSLEQNYPNPFNPTTVIEFSIPVDDNVEIKVFNVLGMEIATLLNEYKKAGTYNLNFYSKGLPGGVYFYQLVSGNYSEIKKMVLLR